MTEDLLSRRRRLMGPNVPTFYEKPVHIVRGEGVWLWDRSGKRYLDCYNNVPHVGHCHPRVVDAIAAQSATLTTHTRYLHTGILDYIERLTGTLNHDLSQAIMVCTGSEANDIALRMAMSVTGKSGFIATDNTYHGNTWAVSQLSTRRPPVGGRAGNVRLVSAPETGGPDPDAFAREVAAAIVDLEETGPGFAGFTFCPVFANEGLPWVAPGWLDPAVGVIRRARGLIIADEVQPGFGRIGSHFWGHDWLGVAPDIATMGKPMANGYPAATVVARPDVMAAFREEFGYFNTFGGNPVAAAAAMAVLDVIEDEGLVKNAAVVSKHMMKALSALDDPGIAEVRGAGLFFGVVLERDGEPDTARAVAVVEKMKDKGVLIGRIGRHMNILKLRPPMPFSSDDADLAAKVMAKALAETRQ